MAALLITASLAIADKIDQKKQARKDKKAHDELRYRELEAETKASISKHEASNGNSSGSPTNEGMQQRTRRNDPQGPPSYEDAVKHH
ncbi:hypothetical protein LTR17_014838 [Elasticomyces elasticus]|nr:hypothetical protein LTR17_014838 [Elasticomyces elasticus]